MSEDIWVQAGTGLICVILGWVGGRAQSSAQIKRLDTENLRELHDKERKADDADEKCKQIGLRLREALSSKLPTMEALREELCTALHHDVVPLFIQMIELKHLLAEKDVEELRSLLDDCVSELRRIAKWLDIINADVFISEQQLTPARITKRTLKPFLKIIRRLPAKLGNGPEAQALQEAIDRVIKAGLVGLAS